jgi:hypothetical protein
VQTLAHNQPALTARCAQSVGLVAAKGAGGARVSRLGAYGAGRAVFAQQDSTGPLASRAADCRGVQGCAGQGPVRRGLPNRQTVAHHPPVAHR